MLQLAAPWAKRPEKLGVSQRRAWKRKDRCPAAGKIMNTSIIDGGWDPPRDETKETRLIEMGKHFHAWRMIQHWSFQCFNVNPNFYDRYPLISILSSSGGESYWVFTIMKTENGWTGYSVHSKMIHGKTISCSGVGDAQELQNNSPV